MHQVRIQAKLSEILQPASLGWCIQISIIISGWTASAAAQVCFSASICRRILALFVFFFFIVCLSVNLRLVEAINELPAEVAI
jgi:hypothetical protein